MLHFLVVYVSFILFYLCMYISPCSQGQNQLNESEYETHAFSLWTEVWIIGTEYRLTIS